MQPLRLPCYCGSLRQATRAITQLYDQHLKPSGLTITQFGLLRLLSSFPDMTSGAMAAAMVMDSTTLTRTLAGLKRQGLIAAEPGEDKRERHWRLSKEGRDVLELAMPYWKAAQQDLKKRATSVDLGGLSQTVFQLVQELGG
jgi:DNA-binding MarR family transcriptional regulator